MTASGRIAWLDLVKLFAIFLVVLGHCIQQFNSGYREMPVFVVLSSFHMPLFMMLSGYLLDYDKIIIGGGKLLTKRLLQLIFPSLFWISVIWCVELLIGRSHLSLARSLWYGLWFLKSLYACTLLLVVTSMLIRRRLAAICVSIVLSQLTLFVPHLWFLQLNTMYPSLIAGMYVKDLLSRGQTVCVTSAASVLLALMIPFINSATVFPDLYPMLTDGWPATYLVLLFKLVVGITASVAILGLFKMLFEDLKSSILSKLSSLGRFTLETYILQALLLETVFSHYVKFSQEEYGIYVMLIYPVLTITIILCCVGLAKSIASMCLGWVFNFNKLGLSCRRCQ